MTSKEEKELWVLSDYILLSKKLVDFSLTPDEWGKYKDILSQSKGVLRTKYEELGSSLFPFEEFYIEADIRSEKMVGKLLQNVLSQSKGVLSEKDKERSTPLPSPSTSSVLIVGGFHTPQITSLLQKQKNSYVVVTPKITKLETLAGSFYLSTFSQKKNPLDQLFDGEKLFVNPE
ncbi:MAG: hypothetical protein ACKVQC_09035 [Elusimicrobiota bacterium]